jgi:hypothetical protein
MAEKMSEPTSTRIPAPWQAAVMAVFVSVLFENNRARKAIAALAYPDLHSHNR